MLIKPYRNLSRCECEKVLSKSAERREIKLGGRLLSNNQNLLYTCILWRVH